MSDGFQKAIDEERRKQETFEQNRALVMRCIDGAKPKTYKMKMNCYNCVHSGYEVEIPWGVWASKYAVPCPKCGCTPDNGGVPR